MSSESVSELSAQELLVQYKERMNDVFGWAKLGYWTYDGTTQTFEVNTDFFITLGHKPILPLTVDGWISHIHPDDIPRVQSHFRKLMAGQIDVWDELYRIQNAAGTYFWFHSVGGITEYALDKRVLRATGVIQNVNKEKENEILLHRKDILLESLAQSATILVNAASSNFEISVHRVLQTLAEAACADRVYIWKNYVGDDGRLKCSQIHEWSPGFDPVQSLNCTQNLDYGKELPTWYSTLVSGKCINNIVREMPPEERAILEPQSIISILAAPIMFKDEFWGFIGFDDCHNERVWSESEEQILLSAGLLLASAICRHNTEKMLEQERHLINRIIETSPIIMIQERDGSIERINAEATKLFALKAGESSSAFYGGQDVVWEIIRKEGIYRNNDYIQTAKDGTQRHFIATVFPIDIEEKTSIGWFVDITDLKEAEANIIKTRDDAQAATQAKSEFLARMSHEIRTPMNAILGIIYLCLRSELTEKQRDYLLKTQTAANNLLGIINDILDFSKIEAGKIELEQIAFHLSDVISEIRDVFEIPVKEKGLKLITDIAPDIVDELLGDPLRLRQILLNLLSNAVKFTPEGSITVTARELPPNKEKHSDDFYSIEFCVTDTGIGLTEKQREGIFDSFTQADTSTTRRFGGTGLGLSIVKRLVELMGGKINVSSGESGKGTTFCFTVKFIKATSKAGDSSAVILNRRRVLIVDDEPSAREVVVELAKTLNLHAESASSGSEALEKLAFATRIGSPYELVLMDWRMPRMDGVETIRKIHSQKNIIIPPPHIVMVSSYDRQDCIRQTEGLNVAGVLTKPVGIKDLKNTLKHAFRSMAKMKEKPKETRGDIRGAKVLLAEDNKVNQLVASELLKMYGVDLTIADNGLEAVEAVKAADFDLVLMDVQMPEMDGLSATQEIRKLDKPNIARLPILAMTANAMDTDYQKSLDVGMNDHLTKPIDPNKLRLALEKWIVR